MVTTVRCPTDPEVETALRCSRCGKPICPRCLVQTPVGARCRECAQLRKLPMYQVSPIYHTRAIVAGLGSAIVGGVAWALLPFGGFFAFFVALGLGYAVGEVVSLSVNRKRGVSLQIIAGVSLFLAYIVSRLAPALISLYNSTGSAEVSAQFLPNVVGQVVLRSLVDPIALLIVALGIVVAVARLK